VVMRCQTALKIFQQRASNSFQLSNWLTRSTAL
jgi:hypothetical protein